MNIPSKIYIDPRLVFLLKTEPDSEVENELCYLSQASVREILRDNREETLAMIPKEIIIQLVATQVGDTERVDEIVVTRSQPLVLALTNLGRIFKQVGQKDWVEFPGPVFSIEDMNVS